MSVCIHIPARKQKLSQLISYNPPPRFGQSQNFLKFCRGVALQVLLHYFQRWKRILFKKKTDSPYNIPEDKNRIPNTTRSCQLKKRLLNWKRTRRGVLLQSNNLEGLY